MNSTIDSKVRADILQRLDDAERQHQVKVLMAIESGSRAWGFASPNSDYDVRFIYVHPQDWYLSVALEDKRDVIEYPIVDEIDINGWELRKALKLFYKSNPAFVEWIQSPITYRESGCLRAEVNRLLPQVYSFERGIYHYYHMAKSNYRGYLKESQVKLKKYFYVLRPLLATRWIEQNHSAAPIEFEKLLVLIDDAQLLDEIHRLLEQKKQVSEQQFIAKIPLLNEYIENELQRLETRQVTRSDKKSSINELDRLFRTILRE